MMLGRVGRLALRRFGDPVIDRTLRTTGVLALVAIPGALAYPSGAPILGFLLVTIWVNGPVSFLFPATYEPILIAMGAIHAPVAVAVVGVAGTVYVEYLNYRFYDRLLATFRLKRLVDTRAVRMVTRGFGRAPFATVCACGLALPFWPLRFIAPMSGYPVGRFLLATAIGRFPRLWLFAALGSAFTVDAGLLFGVAALIVLAAAGAGGWRYRTRRGR